MNNRKNIVLVSASPKVGEVSTSGTLAAMAERQMDPTRIHLTRIDARRSIARHTEANDFKTLSEAEAVLLFFPLYYFCLPGLLMRYLMDWRDSLQRSGKTANGMKVYAVVNCGFPEPEICEEALRVVKSFCREVGAQYRFGIMIGGGGMLPFAKDSPFMKKAMTRLHELWDEILEDVLAGGPPRGDEAIGLQIPRKMYLWVADKNFSHEAHKNGVAKPDILRRPYRPGSAPEKKP